MNKEYLKKYARSLEFDMEDSQLETLVSEFNVLFEQMNLLDNLVGISEYEPMDFPFILDDACLREDNVSDSLSSIEAFKNAKEVKDGCVKSPKVVA